MWYKLIGRHLIDQIRVVLQKGYVLYVWTGMFRLTKSHLVNPKFGQYGSYDYFYLNDGSNEKEAGNGLPIWRIFKYKITFIFHPKLMEKSLLWDHFDYIIRNF